MNLANMAASLESMRLEKNKLVETLLKENETLNIIKAAHPDYDLFETVFNSVLASDNCCYRSMNLLFEKSMSYASFSLIDKYKELKNNAEFCEFKKIKFEFIRTEKEINTQLKAINKLGNEIISIIKSRAKK